MSKKSAAKEALEAAESRRDEAEKSGEAAPLYDFFKVQKTKDENGDWRFKGVRIVQHKFIELLKRLGYRRYTVMDKFVVVRVTDNIIEEVSIPDLRLFVKEYFEDLPEDLEEMTQCPKDELVEKLTCSLGTLLGEDKLSLLVNRNEPTFPIIEDTKDAAYHFYQNGWVQVSKDGVKFSSYDTLPGLVWKDQILPRKYTPLKQADWEKCPFNDFLDNVSDNHKKENGERNDPGRRQALNTLAGYMMHRYFEGNLYVCNLLDSRMNDENNPEGRSGKSLFFKSIRHILNPIEKVSSNCLFFDGKEFDAQNRFKWDKLRRNTKLIVINDVKRGFPIDLLFNAVHDGIEQEKKNGERSNVETKIGITMNYSLRVHGDSAKDRVVEFETSGFYHLRNKPQDVHGHWFFRDWNAEQWNQFDNLMMYCIQQYLLTGIVRADGINLNARKLRDDTGAEFVTFMEELKIEHEQLFEKKKLYEQFSTAFPEVNFKGFSQKLFTKWLQWWVEYRPEMAGYRTTRSSSVDYIRFFHNAPVTPDFLTTEAETTKVRLFEGKSDNCRTSQINI